MKKISVSSILVLFFMTGCYTLNEFVVDYDYSYDGNFPKYNSYNFVQADGKTDFYNGLIQQAIQLRLKSQGYRQKEEEPNLLVLYKVFFEDFYMNAYLQPDLANWTQAEGNRVPISYEPKEEEEEELDALVDEELTDEERKLLEAEDYDPIKCDLREGTLLIAFFDKEGEKSVWQGYASGLFGNKYYNNEKSIRNAVNSILDEYQILADGFAQFDRNN